MSKRKVGFERFGIMKKPSFELEVAQAEPRRLYLPSPPRRAGGDNGEDHDVDNIQYEEEDWEGEGVATIQRAGFLADGGRIGLGKSGLDEGLGGEEDERKGESKVLEGEDGQEEDIDPLDAFMEGIHEEVKKVPAKRPLKAEELDDEEDDPVASYLSARRDAGLSLASEVLHAGYDSDEEVYAAAKAVDEGVAEYDSDDNPIITVNRKKIDALPQLDHSDIDYEPFNKDFYFECAAISGMSDEEVATYRASLLIKVSGYDVARPVKNFEDLGLDAPLMAAISKQGYEKPTPIQCQALPVGLTGRDMIGIAKTGSGKTSAYVLPLIVHIMDQPELEIGEGPIGVICSPTRELAQQIYSQVKKFAKVYGIRVSGVYGGMSKFEQFKELKAGCEIVVATPGRLIDMLKMKAINMLRGTYLILDEADQMFDLGFEPQIRSIIGQIRPDRQTLLFSATMPLRVERLAREVLSDPIRVTVGEVGMANDDITQVVTVLPSDVEKLPWLLNKLPGMVDDGDTLVFASTKIRVEEVEGKLKAEGFKVAALHGDKDQAYRMEVLKKFKAGVFHVLVATDVAARGLDIKSIKSVVNYDTAKDMDSHVHRIGRTGRAGDKDGVAYTLITQKEARFGGELVNSLISAGQNVPMELMDLAMKDGRFRTQREGHRGRGGSSGGKRKGRGRGGGGRGGGGPGPGGGGSGRSVRGVDFGMGIGYNADSANMTTQSPVPTPKKSSQGLPTQVPNRGSAIDALKVGMMARFKSSFVAASPGAVAGGSGSSAATSMTSVQRLPHGGGTRPNERGRGLGSLGATSIDYNSVFRTGNGNGERGGWVRPSDGVDDGLSSNLLPSTGALRLGGRVGGSVAANSNSGFIPRSAYDSSTSSTLVGARAGGNGLTVPPLTLQDTRDGSRESFSSINGAARDQGQKGNSAWVSRDVNQKGEKEGIGSRERDPSQTRERSRERRRPSGWDQ